jgi:hypothetical protein
MTGEWRIEDRGEVTDGRTGNGGQGKKVGTGGQGTEDTVEDR